MRIECFTKREKCIFFKYILSVLLVVAACSDTGETPICGDAKVEAEEACDDGNTITETECDYGTATCTACAANCGAELNLSGRMCGDGTVDPEEACDDGNTITETECDYGTATCTACAAACDSELNLSGRMCGDGTVDPEEECDDGITLTEAECDYGTATCTGCNANCTSWTARIETVGITPERWEGFGLYEKVDFQCRAIWDDGVEDSDCTRVGSPPKWTVSGYGEIEGSDEGASIVWNSKHGAGTGVITADYVGEIAQASLNGTLPSKEEVPPSYYTPYDLPPTTKESRAEFVDKTPQEWEEFYAAKIQEAHDFSDRLEAYVRDWMDGKVPARIPDNLLPAYIRSEKTKDWTLCRPEEVTPEEQWLVHPAYDIAEDFSNLSPLSPDNNCTYLKLIYLAPFGARLVIEGDFPHSRFMNYQILGPFDPRSPTMGGLGAAEVPIVDVDIAGHVNPFRPGADRDAPLRHYRVNFELAEGNAVDLNPQAMVPPAYRAPGNTRVGGPFVCSTSEGLWEIIPSLVWLRYYAPDKSAGPLGGVPLPKAHLELSTGEKFWIKSDFTLAARRQTMDVPGAWTPPQDPEVYIGPTAGWLKMFGIPLIFAEAYGIYLLSEVVPNWPKEWVAEPIQRFDRLHYGRGADLPPPGNYEASASCCNYINYLVRPISLGEGKVIVLTGKLPITPKTRDGEPTATTGDCRYWSIARTGDGLDGHYPLLLYGSLMDEEIVLDGERRYIIAYSKEDDRPSNAVPQAGVTWQDWGPQSRQNLNIRWLSVMPDDHLPAYAPDEDNIPWSIGAWSQPTYDENLVGKNEPGFLGPYHPVFHYMTKEEFEALGNPVDPDAIPLWDR